MSDETVVADLKKNAAERLRVTTGEWQGHKLVSLRVYFEKPVGSNTWLPTKKGVAFRRELLPEVIDALRQAQEAEREA